MKARINNKTMKKIILLALTTLMMVGCDIEIRKQKQPKPVDACYEMILKLYEFKLL